MSPNDLARRGFLRGLVSLPLIGGGVTLLGAPIAAAEPVTPFLLRTYASWLHGEHARTLNELYPDVPPGLRGLEVTNPGYWYHHPGQSSAEAPPSTRAAIVLSAVGCEWEARMSLQATRRRLLGCLAAISAIGAGCTASARPADPVIALARRIREAELAWINASDAEDDLLDEYRRREPEPPEALFYRPIDWTFGLGAGSRRSDGRRWHGSPEGVEIARRLQIELTARGDQSLLAPDPKGLARVDEILAANSGWVADCNRLGDELGVAAASDRTSELFDAFKALLDELVRTPASSLAGALAKAEFCGHLFDGGAEEAFADDENVPASERVTRSIVRDLFAMQERA